MIVSLDGEIEFIIIHLLKTWLFENRKVTRLLAIEKAVYGLEKDGGIYFL